MKLIFKLLLYYIGLTLIGIAWWTDKFFGIVSVDQVLSTIQFSIHGVLTSDPVFISRFMKCAIIWPTCLALLFFTIDFLQAKKKNRVLQPIFKLHLEILFCLIGIIYLSHQFSALSYFKKQFSFRVHQKDYFASYYINPAQVSFRASNPKNLVLIYVESLENTYSNQKIFDHDLLSRLNQEKKSNLSFAHYQQMPGAGWTIAAVVSTQCGLPLKIQTMLGNNHQGEIMDHFLRKATCLSDILAKHGYKNIYMNGSSVYFGGFGKFLRDHHYTEIYGREEWNALGVKDEAMSGWGLFDDDLFAQAKIKLAELMRQTQKFNLTILTIDTHGYDGQLSKTCKRSGYHNFEGIVECTANQISDFVKYIKQKNWLDRVDVVILGDHLAMRNAVSDKINLQEERSIFNLIMTQKQLVKKTEYINHFDFLPTILDALGFDYPDGKLGLGYSALRRHHDALDRSDRWVKMQNHLDDYSTVYNQFM